MEIYSPNTRALRIQPLTILERLSRVATATDADQRAFGLRALQSLLASETDVGKWLRAAIIRAVASARPGDTSANEPSAAPVNKASVKEAIVQAKAVLRVELQTLRVALAHDRQRLEWLHNNQDIIEQELADWQAHVLRQPSSHDLRTSGPLEWSLAAWLWYGTEASLRRRSTRRPRQHRRNTAKPQNDGDDPTLDMELVLDDVMDWLRKSDHRIDYCELAGIPLANTGSTSGKIISDIG
ncbi:MAG: hypothetical protein AAAFM81_06615 [Pseudomonadota bacterium]